MYRLLMQIDPHCPRGTLTGGWMFPCIIEPHVSEIHITALCQGVASLLCQSRAVIMSGRPYMSSSGIVLLAEHPRS